MKNTGTPPPDWLALAAGVATVGWSFALLSGRPTSAFIVAACAFWTFFVVCRARRDRRALRDWGFRADNLSEAAVAPAAVFALAATGFAAYASLHGTLRFPGHLLLLLLVYPAWGVIQQFLVLGVVVGNLERVPRLCRRKALIVLLAAALFGLVHAYDLRLAACAFAFELVVVGLYLWRRNLWPLGVLHGWLGALFYLWVLDRDLWAENFG